MNIVEQLASGEVPRIDPVGTNYADAKRQAEDMDFHFHDEEMIPVLIALITEIQKQAKSIEMFEYNQKWRKRRP